MVVPVTMIAVVDVEVHVVADAPVVVMDVPGVEQSQTGLAASAPSSPSYSGSLPVVP